MTSLASWTHRATVYVEGNSTAETTTDATPRKITNANGTKTVVGMENDAGGGVICKAAGDYLVVGSIDFSGSLSKTFVISVYIDTTSTNLSLIRKLGTGGDVGSAGLNGIITLAVDEVVSLYHHSTDGGTAFTVVDAQFTLVRIA